MFEVRIKSGHLTRNIYHRQTVYKADGLLTLSISSNNGQDNIWRLRGGERCLQLVVGHRSTEGLLPWSTFHPDTLDRGRAIALEGPTTTLFVGSPKRGVFMHTKARSGGDVSLQLFLLLLLLRRHFNFIVVHRVDAVPFMNSLLGAFRERDGERFIMSCISLAWGSLSRMSWVPECDRRVCFAGWRLKNDPSEHSSISSLSISIPT